MTLTDRAAALDLADPLADHRAAFRLPDNVIYLDGNSLGAMPSVVPERLRRVVEAEWGTGLIGSWNEADWIGLARTVGDRIARIVGADPGTVVACDSTSINLYKAVSAAADAASAPVVLTDSGNFPTDIYVIRSVCQARGAELRIVAPDQVEASLGPDVGVVALTQVDYRTGRRHDIGLISRRARESGVLTVWDLAHSAGAFPVRLAHHAVDFAVGCGYKFLNGGPGAPAFIYIAPARQPSARNPINGWFGHVAPFDFDLDFVPAEGIDRARVGTSHILSLAALDAALTVFDDIDMDVVEAKAASLTALFIDAVETVGGIEVVTPHDASRRGSQVSLRHPSAYAIVQALISRGVVGDFRSPDIARFGFAPLYLRHLDVVHAAGLLSEVMRGEAWRDDAYAVRNAVT